MLSSLPDILIRSLAATLDFDAMLRLRTYDARAGGRDHQAVGDTLVHINDISNKSMIPISV